MGALSKLDAVNRMLRASGEQAVSTLVTTSGDALLAEQILDELVLEIQITGQVSNTFEMYLTPDAQGEIAISDDVLHIDTVGEHASTSVVPKGQNPTRLYWLTQHGTTLKNTYDFTDLSLTQGLRVRMVLKQAFEDIPVAQQFQITDEAARRYQMLTMADTTTDQMLRQRSQQSRAIARADDMRQRDVSVFGFASGLPASIAKWGRRSWRGNR
jgi:hypothetical protein